METELEKKKERLQEIRQMKQPVRLSEIRRFGAILDHQKSKQNKSLDVKENFQPIKFYKSPFYKH